MKTKKLNINHIIKLHEKLIYCTGGTAGLRERGLLESALASPFAEYGGFLKYPTIQEKASRLAYCIIKNHPFIDGNKRIGILAMLEFLKINEIEFSYPHDELINLGLSVADGSLDYKDILEFIIKYQI